MHFNIAEYVVYKSKFLKLQIKYWRLNTTSISSAKDDLHKKTWFTISTIVSLTHQ